MVQSWPSDDPFTDAVAPRDARWNAYGRVALWNVTPSYASGGPGVQQNFAPAGRLFNGWFHHLASPPPGASSTPAVSAVRVSSLPATTYNVEGYFSRQLSLLSCSVEASWQIQSDDVVGATNGVQLGVGVIARLQGGTYTGTDEQMILGGSVSCYLFCVISQTTVPFGYKYELLRINAGVPTRLMDTPTGATTFDGYATGSFLTPQRLRMTVEVEGADVRIKCYKRLESDLAETLVFNVLDSSGSKITTTGRVGFLLSNERKPGGSFLYAPCLNWWQAATPDNTSTIYLRDEWSRVNPQGTFFLDATTAWKPGYSLMSSWYGDLFSSAGVWPYAAGEVMWHDGPSSGLERLVLFPSGHSSDNIDGIMLSQRAADSTGSQDRTITGRYGNSGSGTQPRAFGIALRCSPVAPSALPNCYYVVHEIDDVGLTATLKLYRSSFDGLNLIAQLTGLAYALDTDIFLRFTVASVAPDNIARLRVRIAGVLQVLVAPAVPVSGITIAGDGTVDDASTQRVYSGAAEGIYARKRFTSGTSRPLYLDTWTQGPGEVYDPIEPPPPPPPPADLTPIAVSSEIDGAFGTLVLGAGGQWEVELVLSDPGIVQHYENDTAQSFPIDNRIRRSWTITNNAVGSAADAALLVFFDAHGCSKPFSWVTDDGDTAYVVFTTPDLAQKMRSAQCFTYSFGLQERFA